MTAVARSRWAGLGCLRVPRWTLVHMSATILAQSPVHFIGSLVEL